MKAKADEHKAKSDEIIKISAKTFWLTSLGLPKGQWHKVQVQGYDCMTTERLGNTANMTFNE